MAPDTSGGETSGVNEINNALSRRREIFLNLSKSNSIYGNSADSILSSLSFSLLFFLFLILSIYNIIHVIIHIFAYLYIVVA